MYLHLLLAAAAFFQDSLPLKSARMAKFTATKGTWMSVDVSPDGRTIVFDMLGDLYSIPVTGVPLPG